MTSGRESWGAKAADRALAAIAKDLVPLEQAERVQARRERLVPRLSSFLEGEFARTPRRARWPRFAAMAAVLATLLVAVSWRIWDARNVATGSAVVRASAGAVHVHHVGSPTNTLSDQPVIVGARDRIETAEGHAEVNLVSGAVAALGPNTELELATVERSGDTFSERVELDAGKITVKVPKLPPGSRLVIETPHSTVTVHGTAFTVEVHRASDAHAAFTTVAVTEGLVSVKRAGREVFLGPGTQWSSAATADSDAAVPPAATAAENAEAKGSDVPAPVAAPTAPVGRGSTLAQENALLGSAMAARGNGNPEKAIELIDRLLSTYPGSPLVPEARKERSRAVTDLSAARAP